MAITIRSSTELRKNYNAITEICRNTQDPVFLTRNGEGDMVLMDIKAYNRREEELLAAERLFSAEKARYNGAKGYSIDEFAQNMATAIDTAKTQKSA
jgi:prevent-host-death family protein